MPGDSGFTLFLLSKTDEPTTGVDEHHVPPASVGTVPELAEWTKEHQRACITEDPSSTPSSQTDAESYDVSSQVSILCSVKRK